MAYDEVVNANLGTVGNYLSNSYLRWVRAAMQARAGNYDLPAFFSDVVGQFVHGWNTWNEVMITGVLERSPTIVLRGDGDGTNGGLRTYNYVLVQPRLTGLAAADFQVADLEDLSGSGNMIQAGWVAVSVAGDFHGQLDVNVDSQGTAVVAGTYAGLISYRPTPADGFEPLAWLYAVVI